MAVRSFKVVLEGQENVRILLSPSDGEPVSMELARKVARGVIRCLSHNGHPIELTVTEREDAT